MTSTGQVEPGWYPDPAGQHEHRFFDGEVWTEHVGSHGRQSVSPLPAGSGHVPTVNRKTEKVLRDVDRAGATGGPGAGTHLMNEPVLVVNQKAKLIELNNEYAIYNQQGTQVGAVRQVGQSALKKAARFIGSVDQFMTHKFQVVDHTGRVVLALARPAKFVKSRIIVTAGDGAEIGEIKQENAIGKIRFAMVAGGQKLGSISAENWRAWNFSVTDAHGREIARITKTWEGLAKTMFTTADNYVVTIDPQVQGPLRSMVVAAALTVDTALKQDNRGWG